MTPAKCICRDGFPYGPRHSPLCSARDAGYCDGEDAGRLAGLEEAARMMQGQHDPPCETIECGNCGRAHAIRALKGTSATRLETAEELRKRVGFKPLTREEQNANLAHNLKGVAGQGRARLYTLDELLARVERAARAAGPAPDSRWVEAFLAALTEGE